MNQVPEIVKTIAGQLPELKSGSLSLYGEVFGGRIDNQHRIVAATDGAMQDELVLLFDKGEELRIWSPIGLEASSDCFRLGSARRVRWDWTPYGENPTSTTRLFIDYERRDSRVVVTTNMPWAHTQQRSIELPTEPAIEIVWL